MSKKARIEPSRTQKDSLASLLRRQDIWRGHSQSFVAQKAIDSGHEDLNRALLHKGWPVSCLIECAQMHYAAIWFIHGTLLKKASKQGVVVFLNPPAQPYAVSLLQQGVNLDTLYIARPDSKADFIASFVELAKSGICHVLMAWQPSHSLTYAELRRCQLAAIENNGLSFLYRDHLTLKQSSPAALRIRFSLHARYVMLEFLKQKGKLPGDIVRLNLPDEWFCLEEYRDLDLHTDEPLYQQDQATPWLKKEIGSLSKGRASKLISFRQYRNRLSAIGKH